MSYAQEKLYEAVLCLISEGPLRRRLAAAALYIIRLMPAHFYEQRTFESLAADPR